MKRGLLGLTFPLTVAQPGRRPIFSELHRL